MLSNSTFDNIATFFVKDSQARVASGPYNRLQRAVSGAPFCAARKSWVHKDGIHYLHLLHAQDKQLVWNLTLFGASEQSHTSKYIAVSLDNELPDSRLYNFHLITYNLAFSRSMVKALCNKQRQCEELSRIPSSCSDVSVPDLDARHVAILNSLDFPLQTALRSSDLDSVVRSWRDDQVLLRKIEISKLTGDHSYDNERAIMCFQDQVAKKQVVIDNQTSEIALLQ